MARKAWKNLKNWMYSIPIAAMTFLPSCEPENDPPTAKLEVNPITAEVPAQVRMRVTGQDPDGVEDITKYILTIGNENVTSNTPIDITRTFTNEGKINIYGQVTDSKNQSNKTPVKSLELVVGESIDQSASLVNDNEIAYSATIKKIPSAKLTIKRNGNLLIEEIITDNSQTEPDFQKTFKYNPDGIIKGNYEILLKAENLENKKSVTIPNYKPTADFEGVDINIEQDGTLSRTLDKNKIGDKNPEDIALASYTNAKSLDGKTSTSLSGNTLRINALPNQTGNYQVEIEFGSTEGGLEKSVLSGNIAEHSWKYYVNPFVQPNDTTKPIIWNNLSLSQRVAHFNDRLYNYDKTDEMNIPGGVCSDYVTAWIIAFNGYPMEGLEHNNWHNIPAYDVTIRIYNKPTHAAGGVNLGNSVGDIRNWRLIETQNDSTYTPEQLKGFGAYEIEMLHTFVVETETQGKILSRLPIIKFVLNDRGEWVDSKYRHPDINLIESKDK